MPARKIAYHTPKLLMRPGLLEVPFSQCYNTNLYLQSLCLMNSTNASSGKNLPGNFLTTLTT